MSTKHWMAGLFLALALPLPSTAQDRATPSIALPLSFEQTGSADAPAFVSRRPTHTLTLTPEGAALSVPQAGGAAGRTLRMKLVGASRAPEMTGLEPLPGRIYHATVGSRGTLAGNVAYARVKYAGVYPGVDVVYYGNGRQLEFDFLVAPGQDPRQIRLEFSGADRLRLERDGELAFSIGADEIRLKKPRLYQERDGVSLPVDGEYRILDARAQQVAFHVGRYDRSRPLVIDPVIVFATYRGGALGDFPRRLAVNALGEAYLFANTYDPSTLPRNHPHQVIPLGPPVPGFTECFLTKLSRDGTAALYTVIFEGAGCQSMDLAPDGAAPEPKVHLTVGTTGHYQRTLSEGRDGTLTLDLLQGAYDACQLGPCGPIQWMRADAHGNVYFLIEYTPFGMPSGFIHELRKVDSQGQLVGAIELIRPPIDIQPDGVHRIWDQVTGFDIDDSGNAYVIGVGVAPGLIVPTADAFQPTRPSGDVCTDPLRNGCFDAFLLKVNTTDPAGFAIAYASYLGGARDEHASGVAWDPSSGAVYVTGTSASSNFPTTPGSYSHPGVAFLVKLDLQQFPPPSQLVFGTSLGMASPMAVSVLPGGLAAIVGSAVDGVCGTTSCFPLLNSLYPRWLSARNRPFLSVLSADGAALRFSTFLDNLATADSFAFDVATNGSATAYAALTTNDASLATPGALQSSPTGDLDTLVQAVGVADLLAPNDPPEITLAPAAIAVAASSPSGAIVPLICGRLFTCSVDDGDGDQLTHLVWLGPDGYRLANPGVLPAPANRPGIIPGDFVTLRPGVHTFTLLARDERGAMGTATLTIDVRDNTFVGTDHRVVLTDPRFVHDNYRPLGSEHPMVVTFQAVTAPGLTWLASRSDFVPPPPAHLQAGSPPYYYDVTSTAAFTGNIRVCMNIRGMSFARPVDEVQIYAASGHTWTALPNQELNGDTLCADSAGLGTFAIFYAQVPETAITTFAGTGVAEDAIDGPGGDPRDDFAENVPATQSTLTRPDRLARDAAGNIYVADNGSQAGSRIRRIDLTGRIATVGGPGMCDGSSPIAVYGTAPVLYCVRWNEATGLRDILRINLSLPATDLVVSVPEVLAMTVDANGNLLYSDGWIYRVSADGGEPRLVFAFDNRGGALTLPYFDRAWTLAFDAAGHLLAGGFTLIRISPGADGLVNGSPDETVEQIGGIPGVNVTGYSQPFSGDGLPASDALLTFTYQMIVAADGAVLFTDQSGRTRRIDPGADGIVNGGAGERVTTVAGYFSSTLDPPSAFATSEYTSFRGLLEDPVAPGSFIGSSHGRHQLQRFGLAPRATTATRADLEVSAEPATDRVAVNTPATFNVVLTNHGPAAAAEAGVLMPIPSGAAFVSASSPAGVCSVVFGRAEWFCAAGTVSPGGSVVMTFHVTPSVAGTLNATFETRTSAEDPDPANNVAAASVVVTGPIEIVISETIHVSDGPPAVAPAVLLPVDETIHVSDGPPAFRMGPSVSMQKHILDERGFAYPAGEFDAGQTVRFRLRVTNAGVNATAGPVTVTDVLDARLAFAAAASDQRCVATADRTIVCTATPPLAVGAFDDFLLVAVIAHDAAPPQQTVTIVNQATVAAAGDEDASDNSSSVVLTVRGILPPSVFITKDVLNPRTRYRNGDVVTFRLTVTNRRNASGNPLEPPTFGSTFGPISIADTLDPRLTFVSAADPRCAASAQAVECFVTTPLPPGGALSFDVTVRIADDAAPAGGQVAIPNTAVVSTAGDADPSDNTATATLTVVGPPAPDVSIVKSIVDETSPCGAACQEITVSNGAEVRFRLGVTLASFGGPLTGTVTVTDTLAAGLSLVSASGLQSFPRFICSNVGQQITCTLHGWQSMNPGDVNEIEIVTRVGAAVAGLDQSITLANMAEATAPDDQNAANDTSGLVTVRVNGPRSPDVSIAKSIVDQGSPCGVTCQQITVSNGDEVRFRLAAALSLAGGPLTGTITVTDTLPAGLTLISADGLTRAPGFICSAVGQQITCTLHVWQNLNPGDVHEIEIVARVGPNVAGSNQIVPLVNLASASTPNDRDASNNASAPVTVRVIGPQAPDVSAAKSMFTGSGACDRCRELTVSNGDEVEFVIDVHVAEAGAAPGGPITFTDSFPIGLVPLRTNGGDFTCVFAGQLATCALHPAYSPIPGDTFTAFIVARVGTGVAGVNQTVTLMNVATATTPEDRNAANDTSQPVTIRVQGPPAGAPTAPGTNVVVQPTDAGNVPQPVSIRFTGVTAGGHTTAIPVIPPPAAPAHFGFRGAVYEIATTATVIPPIEVCFSGSGFTPFDAIWHAGAVLPAAAHTVRSSTLVCGLVSSLSPFGVVTPAPGVADQILALADQTVSFLDLPGLGPKFRVHLDEAAASIGKGRIGAACSALKRYIVAVRQASSSALTAAEKSALIAEANRIADLIGCR